MAMLWLTLFASGCVSEKVTSQHLDSGIAYLESQQYPSAMKELMAAEKQHPQDPVVHYYLGVFVPCQGIVQRGRQGISKSHFIKIRLFRGV